MKIVFIPGLISSLVAYICTAFMEWAGLENLKDTPKKISIPGSNSSKKNREYFVNQCLSQFVEEYFLTEFDVEKEWRKNEEKRTTEKDQEESNDINVIEEEVVNISSITDHALVVEINSDSELA